MPPIRRSGRGEGRKVIALTHRRSLQKISKRWRANARAALGPDISVAIIAVDNESGEVLARVGSPDYFDERRAGQVDMTARCARRARR
jgi:penicillin-binding protein 1C